MQSDLVPVGEDQTQHLELTREIADVGKKSDIESVRKISELIMTHLID